MDKPINADIIINDMTIQKRIYTIRNLQVMLDKDLAILYDVKPIRLREQVKRNLDRFPEDFMFQLTDDEVNFMVSQKIDTFTTLVHLSEKASKNVKISIWTKIVSKRLKLDLQKHNAQYVPIEVKTLKHSHDRFLLIDEKIYHLGASLKDLGKKWFAFSLIEEDVFELKKKIGEVLNAK